MVRIMKVDLLHYSSPPIVGGVESVMAHHARLMADAGHEVRILAGRGDVFDERVQFVHIPFVDSRHTNILEIKRDLDQGNIPPQFPILKDQLVSTLKEITLDTDVLIAHNVCSLSKNLALTAALYQLSQERNSPRLILWHHDLAWTTPRYRSELHDGYPWDLLRRDWAGAKQVVVSALRRQELAELLGIPLERVVVVPNGLDIERFLKLEERSVELVSQLDLLGCAPLLLLPVRITPRKNIELALGVLAALRIQFPQAALVVTGPLGPHNPANIHYFNRLLSLRESLGLKGCAHFLAEISSEYLPDGVIADFYSLADALIFPSREEGFGIPILEAGMTGLPIFCADISPLRELAGENALYYDPDSAPEVVASMISDHFASNPIYDLRVRVKKHYTWQQLYVEQIEPLLTEVVSL